MSGDACEGERPLGRSPSRPALAGRFIAFATAPGARSQAIFILIVLILGLVVWHTAQENLSRLSVKSGFAFLLDAAPFELGETPIPYHAGDSYLRAFAAGTLNTLKVAVLGIVLSTLLGLFIALGQLSSSAALARVCRGYIETVRNVPLLLQLIFWHTFLTRALPTVREALSPVEGVYLTNRGLYLPAPLADPLHAWVGLAALAGAVLAFAVARPDRRTMRATGRRRSGWRIVAALIAPPALVFIALGAPLAFEAPAFKGFNFRGGMTVSPEFTAMLLGLTLYTAAFNAEIIRAGILGVPKGQSEAGFALGLSRGQVTRKIVLPQALRIIIPPMSNSYLNLTKESSLAVAIGYPEIVRVANITLAETSQAIECVSIIMLLYLTLSLITAAFLGWVNRRAALVER